MIRCSGEEINSQKSRVISIRVGKEIGGGKERE